jgi:hypothetical protein
MRSVSSMIAHICVNRLDDFWLSCLDLEEHEFELVHATMVTPHGWILGARLSDHTEDGMSIVVIDADSEFFMLIRTRSVLFLKKSVFVQKEAFLGLATAHVRINIFLC